LIHYQELGEYDAALTALSAVEAAMPEWPVAIAARGFVEGAAGRAAKAVATEPNRPPAQRRDLPRPARPPA
jgi:hypothetical protein